MVSIRGRGQEINARILLIDHTVTLTMHPKPLKLPLYLRVELYA